MPGSHAGAGDQAGLAFPFRSPRHPRPLDLAWEWRWEIGVVSVAAFFSVLIAISLGDVGLIAAAGAGLAALGTMMCWPPARKLIVARWWWLVTPHRIRVGCARGWITTLDGRLPIIMSCAPAGYGERVRLWLPAGLTAGRLRAASEELAAACWAAEVQVIRDPRHAHRVTLEVIRDLYPQGSLPYPHPGGLLAAQAADPSEGEAAQAGR